MTVDAPILRRALVRAAVFAILAVPTAAAFSNAFGALLAGSFALATIPLSVAELALRPEVARRLRTHTLFWFGALVLIVSAIFEAAYAEGVYRSHSLQGGLEGIAALVGPLARSTGSVGHRSLAMTVALASGIAVSLWAPFAGAQLRPKDLDHPAAFWAYAIVAALHGVAVTGLAIGTSTCLALGEPPIVIGFALMSTALGALPGSLLVPITYSTADWLERAYSPPRSATTD